MKLNIKLLNRIKKHLIAEPKRYDQGVWGVRAEGRGAPACGTRACIAGWAVLLSIPKGERKDRVCDYLSIPGEAQRILGLTADERINLFAHSNQDYIIGKRGVKEACKKIDALIAARKKTENGR